MTKVAMFTSLSSIASPLRRFSRLAAVLAFAVVAPAVAAEPKPDFAVKTQYIDASVILDDGIKSNGALAADCLAEGKRWVEDRKSVV